MLHGIFLTSARMVYNCEIVSIASSLFVSVWERFAVTMLYSSHLFLIVPSVVARIIDCIFFFKWRHFVSTFAWSSTIGWSYQLESIDRSVGRSVDGAYLLGGMHIRKWRAEKNGDLELIPKIGRSLATDLRGRWAVRVNDATLLLVNENPTPDSVVLYVQGSNWQERLVENEGACDSIWQNDLKSFAFFTRVPSISVLMSFRSCCVSF